MSVLFTRRGTAPIQHDPVFANNEWDAIIKACQSGKVPDEWAVGDSKPMIINGIEYQIDIIGKDHDTYSDGTGTAPLTFQLHECYATTYPMNSSNTNVGGWTASAMRTTHLPAIFALLPGEVQSGIRDVNKLTSAGAQSPTINITADKLFLLSEVEIFGTTTHSVSGEGTQYAYYENGGSKKKGYPDVTSIWRERSPSVSNTTPFCIVDSAPKASHATASNFYGVSFAFCF